MPIIYSNLRLPLAFIAFGNSRHAKEFQKVPLSRCFCWHCPLPSKRNSPTVTNADDTIAITGYTGSGGDVVIPATITGLPVTSIGSLAFWANSTLTNVTLPDSVTIIGDRAFTGTALICISIPNSITNIGEDVFADCLNLTNDNGGCSKIHLIAALMVEYYLTKARPHLFNIPEMAFQTPI